MNQEIYEEAFVDELNKIAEGRADSALKGAVAGATIGGGIQAGRIGLAYKKMKKNPFLNAIMKNKGFRKTLKPGAISKILKKGLGRGALIGAGIAALYPRKKK